MSRTYTHVQELLPSVLSMKGKGYTYMKEHGLNPDKYRSWIDYQRTGSSAAN